MESSPGLSQRADEECGVEIGVFGFQNYEASGVHRPDLPSDIYVYDAWAKEEPKSIGFGIEKIHEAVAEFKPDVCIVYNDLLIISNCVNKLCEIEDYKSKFKIVAYIDQVYLHQKKVYLELVNTKADAAIAFTEEWKNTIVEQGLRIPCHVLQHGFDASTYFPIPKAVARSYLGLNQDDFLVLNLNRNQPRKRWDTCLKAFAEIVSRYPNDPIKLIIGTALQGSWDLVEIYERELKKRGLTLQDGLKHIVVLENPQKLTDYDVNVVYNVADIGINTCDGEGFGLCNFEQAAIGVPQVVPRLGGFLEFFNDDRCSFVDPCLAYYVDTTRDHVCGEALLCSYSDVVSAFEVYYHNRELIKKHGEACRAHIPKTYSWEIIYKKLVAIVAEVTAPPVVVVEAPATAAEARTIETTDTAVPVKVPIKVVTDDEEEGGKPAAAKKEKSKKGKKGKKGKTSADKPEMDVQAELARMRQAIEMLLAAKA